MNGDIRSERSRLGAAGVLAWALLLGGCGGGSSPADSALWAARTAKSAPYAAQCATPREGSDPFSGAAYPDRPGTLDIEKLWLRTYMDEIYLWYPEIPTVDPAPYTDSSVAASIRAMLTSRH